jgi:hypothetical protein
MFLKPTASVPSTVQAESTPLVGVPSNGVTKVGDVANTKAPVPVSSVTAEAKFAEDGVPRNVATPVPSPETPVDIGKPVHEDNTPCDGVPSTGVVSVGDVRVLFVTVAVFVVVKTLLGVMMFDNTVMFNPLQLQPQPVPPDKQQ